MRWVAVAVVLLFFASGCASKSDGSASDGSASRSSSGLASASGPPLLGNTTMNGTALPTILVGTAPFEAEISGLGTTAARVRLVANATFSVQLNDASTRAPSSFYRGFALFPAGQDPRLLPTCTGLTWNRAWDSRLNGTSSAARFTANAGSWDLWIWLNLEDKWSLFFNDGNPQGIKVGSATTGWTTEFVEPQSTPLTPSASVSFEQALNATKGGLFWGRYASPNMPSVDGTLSTEVDQNGKVCVSTTGTRQPSKDGLTVYLGTALAPGSATWKGSYTQTAPMVIVGGTATYNGLLLKPI